jgi:hypothetical protein
LKRRTPAPSLPRPAPSRVPGTPPTNAGHSRTLSLGQGRHAVIRRTSSRAAGNSTIGAPAFPASSSEAAPRVARSLADLHPSWVLPGPRSPTARASAERHFCRESGGERSLCGRRCASSRAFPAGRQQLALPEPLASVALLDPAREPSVLSRPTGRSAAACGSARPRTPHGIRR